MRIQPAPRQQPVRAPVVAPPFPSQARAGAVSPARPGTSAAHAPAGLHGGRLRAPPAPIASAERPANIAVAASSGSAGASQAATLPVHITHWQRGRAAPAGRRLPHGCLAWAVSLAVLRIGRSTAAQRQSRIGRAAAPQLTTSTAPPRL